jgi:hypothetical protein
MKQVGRPETGPAGSQQREPVGQQEFPQQGVFTAHKMAGEHCAATQLPALHTGVLPVQRLPHSPQLNGSL